MHVGIKIRCLTNLANLQLNHLETHCRLAIKKRPEDQFQARSEEHTSELQVTSLSRMPSSA